jgi:hypothetical protein
MTDLYPGRSQRHLRQAGRLPGREVRDVSIPTRPTMAPRTRPKASARPPRRSSGRRARVLPPAFPAPRPRAPHPDEGANLQLEQRPPPRCSATASSCRSPRRTTPAARPGRIRAGPAAAPEPRPLHAGHGRGRRHRRRGGVDRRRGRRRAGPHEHRPNGGCAAAGRPGCVEQYASATRSPGSTAGVPPRLLRRRQEGVPRVADVDWSVEGSRRGREHGPDLYPEVSSWRAAWRSPESFSSTRCAKA